MSRQDFKYIWLLLKDIAGREKKTIISIIIASVTAAAAPYIRIVCMGMLLDGLYQGAEYEMLFGYMTAAVIFSFFCKILESRTSEWFWQKEDYTRELDLRELNRKSFVMDYEYLEDTHVQELKTRAFARSYFGIRGWLLLQMKDILKNILSVLIAVMIMVPVFMETKAGHDMAVFRWVSVMLFLVIGIMIWRNYRAGINYTRKAVKILDTLDGTHNKSNYYLDILSGVESQKDLRINRQQAAIEKDVEALFNRSKEGEKRMGRLYIRRQLTGVTISALSGFFIYMFTGFWAYMGMITIGNVVTYASSIVKLTHGASNCAIGAGHMKSVALYARDYIEYMNLKKRKLEGTIPVEKRRDNRFQVDFEHVSFRYPGTDKDVIKDLNLSFVIGEKMAIVGKNGSGKTTFIKLLCRLYDVTEGCIKVNGIDIRKYNYQEYCALFAVVFQDFNIFAFSLSENIAGAKEAEKDRAVDALIRAGFGGRLKELPDGLDTYIGKEFSRTGVAFSGGEKQKMAIARAIYKDAPFVIMDEPTAALDPLAECDVYAGFDKMVGEKTALYISHRLASCRFCRDILVFDKGQVVQRGTHEELESRKGLYRELWRAQAQYYK